MRRFFGIAVFGLGACSPEGATNAYGPHFEAEPEILGRGPYQVSSSYSRDLAGVILPDLSGWAVAGIEGQTCQMDFLSGDIDVDLDFGPGTDRVLDGRLNLDLGLDILVGSYGDVRVVGFPSGDAQGSWSIPNYVAGALTNAGPVLITENSACAVEWPTTGAVSLLNDACGDSVDLAADAVGTAFLATNGRLVRVDAVGVTELAMNVDHLAFDADLGVIYVGGSSETTVRALDLDGVEQWSRDVGGDVDGLVLDADAGVVASVAREVGESALVGIDSAGLPRFEQSLARPASELAASADGNSIAVLGRGRVDFLVRTSEVKSEP